MSPRIQELYQLIRDLDKNEREELLDYARQIDTHDDTSLMEADEPWDEVELAELLRHEPRSTKTLSEDGLIGAWANLPKGRK